MTKALRIIFIGTPDFAVGSLKRVYESGRNVVAVITAPDRKAGRGQQLKASAVKTYALEQNIPVLQPTNLKAPDFIEELKALQADLQIVVAFRMLPEMVWNMPPLGTFNLHASLLPNYRGAAPINWAIMNGEKETGVTTFFLKHQIDTGDLLLQERVQIVANETAGSLHDKLMNVGSELVLKSLDKIESENYRLIEQQSLIDEKTTIKEAPKIFKEDCRINWNVSAQEIDQKVRGLSPYPTAWSKLEHLETGKQIGIKIYAVSVQESSSKASIGSILLENKSISIACGEGEILLKELQLEGKKRMTAQEASNGFEFSNYKMI